MLKNNARHPNPKNNPYLARLLADFEELCGKQEKIPNFFIGPIKKSSKNKITIQNYDPGGLLDKKLTSIKYDDITTLKFGDRYSTTFRKYLQEQK
jgi:hypothetical protein